MELRPILVFDSGFGGLSILDRLIRVMPSENYVYFGDNAFAPYGIRSTEEVQARTIAVVRSLVNAYDPRAIVIACNTATSAAIQELRDIYKALPVIGTEPAIKPAVLAVEGVADRLPRILALATPITLKEKKFQDLMSRFAGRAEIDLLPAPELVSIIESQTDVDERATAYLRDCSAKKGFTPPYDAIVLGCTHFPFVKKSIQTVFGPEAPVFDSSDGVARRTKDLLAEILADGRLSLQFDCSSPNPDAFRQRCGSLLRQLGCFAGGED